VNADKRGTASTRSFAWTDSLPEWYVDRSSPSLSTA